MLDEATQVRGLNHLSMACNPYQEKRCCRIGADGAVAALRAARS